MRRFSGQARATPVLKWRRRRSKTPMTTMASPFFRLLLLIVLACPVLSQAQALRLSDDRPDVDAWPAVTMLADPGGTLPAEAVLQRLADFTAPTGPHANLGVRRDVVWLRLPLQVPADGDGRWILDIDYPSLDRVDVHLVSGGRIVRSAVLGDHLAFDERVVPSRSHALPLVLERGVEHELLLRVQTTSSMIVPIRLMKAQAFHAREARLQMLQGLAAGICLCLLSYALAHWVDRRESMFLHYAVTIGGISMFFFAYHGLAAQYLWPHQRWLTDNMAPLAVLVGLGGSLPLVERLLDVQSLNRPLARAMRAAAAVAFAAAALFALDLIDYRAAHLTGTLLGPLPVLLAVRAAWQRWRQGDRAAPYLFVGWAGYFAGVLVMAALLRGWIASNAVTQNAFQVASLFEALMWLRVLGVRNEEARRRAERADRERQVLHTLAHTDALTGLPNRRGLEAELASALPAAGSQRVLAVFLLDLDGFKAVNDRHGHDIGDALLVAAAARLRAELRHRDGVARLGGDEFVVLARDLAGEADAWQLGRKLVAAFETPFELQGRQCRVGLTVGFALAPLDGQDTGALLRRADAAMYAGKQSGKGTVRRGAASIGLAGA